MQSSIRLDVIDAALTRAQQTLWRTQRDDGGWGAACDQGPVATAQVIVALRFLGKLRDDDAAAAARWLARQQRADGSFGGRPFAPSGDPSATAMGWAALIAAGVAADDDRARRARAFVDAHGGLAPLAARMQDGDLVGLFLAMAGLLDAAALPEPPRVVALVPIVDRLLERRFSVQLPFLLVQSSILVEHLRGGLRGAIEGALLGALERDRCLALLDRWQNADGSWLFGDTMHAALALATLRALGVPDEDARVARGLAWLDGRKRRDEAGVWFSVFDADVWTTAFTVRALRGSGVPPTHPSVARATAWLVAQQIARDEAPNGVGAWAFQSGNTKMPDCDDVGVVLGALGAALDAIDGAALDDAIGARARDAVDRALAWLDRMQNADGGWASFQHGMPGKRPGAMMTAPLDAGDGLLARIRFFVDPPAEVGDPATEDVTGRVLHGLGQHGYTVDAPAVRKAIAFLESQQCEDGAFWGRWVVNYLAATAWVLRGLRAVAADLAAPWVRRAIAFVVQHQNADGGWGEEVASYRDPARAGVGPSTPGLTGLVVTALVEAGEGGSPAVESAIRYLLREERLDGTWPNGDLLHALVPPDWFYVLPGAPSQLALEALGAYRAHVAGDAAVVAAGDDAPAVAAAAARESRDANGDWSGAFLQQMHAVGDPAGDLVVAEIFADGAAAAVSDLFARLTRADDPVPPGLPPRAARYFEETEALPPWADRARIDLAQRLFTRCGWGVGTALYCSSLPQLYAFPVGAHVLRYTQGLERHAWRRIVETAQFVFDVAEEGALAPKGRGVRTAQKIRLMHAAIRHLESRQPTWQSAWGVPINQTQLATTLVTFGSVVVDGLRRMRFDVSDDEAEAWVHTWNVIGHYLGIRDDLLPRDVADGHALLWAMERREWGASPEAAALTAATLDLMRKLLPPAFGRLPATLVRHLAGDHCADLLSLPASDWTSALFDAAAEIEGLLGGGDHHGAVARLAQRASFLLMKGLGAAAREGKPVGFRIPEALVRAWDDRGGVGGVGGVGP